MKNQIREYQMFTLNEEIYGIPTEKVKGICTMREYSKSLKILKKGNLHLVDLRKKLEYVGKDYDENTSIITVDVSTYGITGTCGIIVDSVQNVWDIESKEICEPLPYGTFIERELLSGMGIVKDEVVTFLDVDMVVSQDALNKLQNIRINNFPEIEAEKIDMFDQQWLSITENLWPSKTPVMYESMIG